MHHGCNEFVHYCMPRPQALWSTLLTWLLHECRCLVVGSCNAILKFVTSIVLCGLGMQQCAMHNATIQKTTFFELGVFYKNGTLLLPFLQGEPEQKFKRISKIKMSAVSIEILLLDTFSKLQACWATQWFESFNFKRLHSVVNLMVVMVPKICYKIPSYTERQH